MKRITGTLLGLAVILGLIHVATSYNILFMLPMGSKSHKNVFDPVAEELGKRGHKVTLFSAFKAKKDPPGVTSYVCKEIEKHWYTANISMFDGEIISVKMMTEMFRLINRAALYTFTDPFVTDLIKEPIDPTTKKPKFDLVIVDAVFNDYALALGHHLGVPTMIFSPSTTFHHHAWNMDIPFPLSYIPSAFSDYPDPMDFVSRSLSTISQMIFLFIMNWIILPQQDAIVRNYLPNTPPIIELEGKVSFMLANSHPALNVRKPKMPYTADVGGTNIKPANPLPKDFEDFMKSSGKDGVIYFSLGSITNGTNMPLAMRTKILEVFSKLPQKIIWKFEDTLPDLPKNIKLTKWAPQNDLLAHPQMRLFITHGGLLSAIEAAYHGVPLLGFPLSADQLGNMVQFKKKGFGEHLDWRTFTQNDLSNAIDKILNTKSYKENALFASELLKDQLVNPVHEAAYWMEYVIRHKGASFLKASTSHLNFFQYFLLDIIAVIVGVLVIILVITYYSLKLTFRLLSKVCKVIGFGSGSKKPAPKRSKNKKKNN